MRFRWPPAMAGAAMTQSKEVLNRNGRDGRASVRERTQVLAASLLAAGIFALLSACAPPDLTALDAGGGAIVAKKMSGELPLDPLDMRWRETVSRTLDLYPQQSVPPASSEADVRRIEGGALDNGKAVALR